MRIYYYTCNTELLLHIKKRCFFFVYGDVKFGLWQVKFGIWFCVKDLHFLVKINGDDISVRH